MKKIMDAGEQEFEERHSGKVRKLAAECTVLLKNDGILPLKQAGKIALYGSGARRTIKGGTGSGDVNVRHFVTVEEGLLNAGFEITTSSWLDGYDQIVAKAHESWVEGIRQQAAQLGIAPIMLGMGAVMPEPDYTLPLDGEGDTAIYVLSRISGEGNDRKPVEGDIKLSETEIRDITTLNEKYEKFVLVLNVGGMVDLTPVEKVKSILVLGQLGTPTGDVCADILLGKAYPSGKLTMTWAPIDQYPSTEGFGDMNDTRYTEGIYVGYRYFDTMCKKPSYPFGYGLGYTEFDIITKECKADEEQVCISTIVTNTGDFVGKETVQVYVTAPEGEVDKPYQELKAFQKTEELAPGESQEIGICFETTSLASYSDKQSGYVLEEGNYIIRVGNSSDHTSVAGVIHVNQTVVTETVKHICGNPDFEDLTMKAESVSSDEEFEAIELDVNKIALNITHYSKIQEEIVRGEEVHWSEVKNGNKTIWDFIAGLSDEQLADLAVGNYEEGVSNQSVIGASSTLLAGGAGETTGHLKELGLDILTMADGPAGIRISTEYKVVGDTIKSNTNALGEMLAEFSSPEELAQMAAMMPPPSQEELDASVYYQYCVAIPIGTDLAQSFNVELCEELGDVVGEEMEIFGVNFWLAPALNIQRSPLCGRNFEYYSEDPLVSGKIAAAITAGVQKHPGCGTTIKHFAANNQETNRYTSNSLVSERALREIYLKGFEIAVKEGKPKALMTSYNLINGEHSSNSKDLLTYVLRDEWGYEGVVMTDWYTTTDMMVSPQAKYPCASAAGCVKAGNNLSMSGMPSDKADIMDSLTNPNHPYPLTRAELQANAGVVLKHILDMHEEN